MPFGSYEASKEQAFNSAARILKETHCGAVKLEGGVRMAETIAFLAERGVPVMAHIGLTPQSINSLGSFRSQGQAEAQRLIDGINDPGPIQNDAIAVAQAGAFSVVVEAVAEPLARRITEIIAIPTIGIGASAACDGQVLVLEDMAQLVGPFLFTLTFAYFIAPTSPIKLPGAPFLLAGALLLVAMLIAMRVTARIPAERKV